MSQTEKCEAIPVITAIPRWRMFFFWMDIYIYIYYIYIPEANPQELMDLIILSRTTSSDHNIYIYISYTIVRGSEEKATRKTFLSNHRRFPQVVCFFCQGTWLERTLLGPWWAERPPGREPFTREPPACPALLVRGIIFCRNNDP